MHFKSCFLWLLLSIFLFTCDSESIYFSLEKEEVIVIGSLPNEASFTNLIGPDNSGFLYTNATSSIFYKNIDLVDATWTRLQADLLNSQYDNIQSIVLFDSVLFLSVFNALDYKNYLYRVSYDTTTQKWEWVSLLKSETKQGEEDEIRYFYQFYATDDKLYIGRYKTLLDDGENDVNFEKSFLGIVNNPTSLSEGSLFFTFDSSETPEQVSPITAFNLSSNSLGSTIENVVNIAKDSSGYWLAANIGFDSLLLKSNDGVKFTELSIDVLDDRIDSFQIENGALFVSLEKLYQDSALFVSDNVGVTWREIGSDSLSYGPVALVSSSGEYLVGSVPFSSSILGEGLYYMGSDLRTVSSITDSIYEGNNYLATRIINHGVIQIYVDDSPPEAMVEERIYVSSLRNGLWSIDLVAGSYGDWKLE